MSVQCPPQVQRMLGEATIRYAYREFQQAVRLLVEIVRLCPGLPHPYQTLGLMYEEMGEQKKAVALFMMAAHLSKHDPNQWRHIATLSLQLGDKQQAVYCYTRLLSKRSDDIEALWELSLLNIELGQLKKATEGLEKLYQAQQRQRLSEAARQDAEQISEMRRHQLRVLRLLAQQYLKLGQLDKCAEVLSNALERRGIRAGSMAPIQDESSLPPQPTESSGEPSG